PRPPHSFPTRRSSDLELALIEGARARRLPMLAICRGIQILNVALGGTLYQDLASERPSEINHADSHARHGLRIEAGSRLHDTLRSEEHTSELQSRSDL